MTTTTMCDADLFTKTVPAIRRAAAGEAAGGNDTSYEYAMVLMAESQRRHRAAGHTERCRSDVYSRAYEQATADHAGRPAELPTCTCGKDS